MVSAMSSVLVAFLAAIRASVHARAKLEAEILALRHQLAVRGRLDCRLRDLDGATVIEWSWQGQSDTDPGCGRG
jgi:hypothetical protein